MDAQVSSGWGSMAALKGYSKKAWYLIYTKPRQEHIAKENLARQGFSVYLPLVRQLRRRAGRRIGFIEPLFPRYMFIRLDTTTDNWSPIRSTFGVSTLVHFGFRPATVPDDLVALLSARENPEGLHETGRAPQPGDRVRIEDGPMAGYEGLFLATSGRERVLVLLEIMGKEARVQVPAGALGMAV